MYNRLKVYITQVVIPLCLVISIILSLPLLCESQSEHGHSHDHGHSHENVEEPASFKYSREANEAFVKHQQENTNNDHAHFEEPTNVKPYPNLWFEAIGSTLLISIAPYLILFIIPVTNKKEHEPYLKVLLAFASGGLLGDAFLHLIPHALMAHNSKNAEGSHSHSHSHSHSSGDQAEHSHDNSIGVSVLAGIITFLVVEKFVRIFKGGHGHSHNVVSAASSKKSNGKDKSDAKSKGQGKEKKQKQGGDMKVAGYLNLAADFTHNLTDGLAIGASFLAGRSVGIVTTLTICLHEIPHEIGDFAILLQSGCSRRKAMMLQLVTAFGALTGTVISLMAEGADDSFVAWILPFTAGGFIYIATVSVIPELLENSSFLQSVAEVVALLLGVALMVVITWVEEAGHD